MFSRYYHTSALHRRLKSLGARLIEGSVGGHVTATRKPSAKRSSNLKTRGTVRSGSTCPHRPGARGRRTTTEEIRGRGWLGHLPPRLGFIDRSGPTVTRVASTGRLIWAFPRLSSVRWLNLARPIHWWKKGLQLWFAKTISSGCSNRD
jgi:hypothetical protein